MRVLHVGKALPPVPGGMETYLGDLLVASRRQGIEAAALVHQPTGVRIPSGNRFGGTPIFTARTYGHVLYAPLSPSFPLALQRAIREFRPDILHLHVPNTSAFTALVVPSARRLPWVLHWQADVDPKALDRRLRWAYPFYRPLESALLRRARRILVASQAYLDASAPLAPWHERCEILPLGIDPLRLPEVTEEARAQAAREWPNWGGRRILALGRLAYYKGFDVLLRALAKRRDGTLVIVGEGAGRPTLEREIQRLGLTERVRLLGHRPDPDMQALLAASDMLCLPSLDRSEAFGLVLLEALRYGRPVVASDIPGSGVGWVVRTAGHGLLVQPGDASALAEALRRLDEEPGLYEHLCEVAAADSVQRFHVRENAVQLAEIYQSIKWDAPSNSGSMNRRASRAQEQD